MPGIVLADGNTVVSKAALTRMSWRTGKVAVTERKDRTWDGGRREHPNEVRPGPAEAGAELHSRSRSLAAMGGSEAEPSQIRELV